jgi:hypothetical protein
MGSVMANTGPGIPMEQVSVFTVLGIQFWDPGLDQPVTDGLAVTAQLEDSSFPVITAFRTASGAYAFQGLPGLHSEEYPPANSVQASPPKSLRFVITVSDSMQRYLPAIFAVDLPLGYPGLFLSNSIGSPAASNARAYLFSAATRSIAPGSGAVRADIWDRDRGQPAAFAALQLSINSLSGSQTWTGIADYQGRLQLQFPSPPLQSLSLGSPPGSGQGAPSSVTWPISVKVLYEPSQLRFPLAGLPDEPWPWTVTPSLKSILGEQNPASIWQNESGPPVAEWAGQITYGTPLVLRTTSSAATAISSVLMVSQSTSP